MGSGPARPSARPAPGRAADEQRLQEALDTAVGIDDALSAIRYSKDPLPAPLPAVRSDGVLDVLFEQGESRVLVVGWGQFAGIAVEVGARLAQQGIGVRVVDPVWALPVSADLVRLAGTHDLVVTIEDGGLAGGLGSRLAQECRLAGGRADVREPASRSGSSTRAPGPASSTTSASPPSRSPGSPPKPSSPTATSWCAPRPTRADRYSATAGGRTRRSPGSRGRR